MLVALPHLSVSHGYLSCTNIDDGLHTHTHTVLRPPCSHISQTSVVYTWFRMMNTYKELGLTAAHLVKIYAGNAYVTMVLHIYIYLKCDLWILDASLSVIFVYGTYESIVLQLTSLKTSLSSAQIKLFLVRRLMSTAS
jgi:hypothetical protein